MKKSFIRFISVILMTLICCSVFVVSAGALAEGEFSYIVTDLGAVITSYTGDAESVKIPDNLGGKNVVGIVDGAFMNKKELTAVTIPDTVISVGRDAFFGTKLYNTSANWTDGIVLYIDDILVDVSYKAVGEIKVKEGTRLVADYCVAYSKSVTEVTLPSSVKNVGKCAFEACDKLKAINVSASNKSYASESGVLFDKAKTTLVCYSSAKTGATYEIPATVNTIEASAFMGNSKLVKITVPKTVKKIGSYAFSYCSALAGANLPEGLTTVSEGMFQNCSNLSAVELPSTTTTIGNNAFEWCSALTALTLPSNVKNIGDNSFYCCRGLKDIFIPDSVKTIGESAFYGCKALDKVNFEGTQTQYKAISVGEHNLPLKEAELAVNSKGLVKVGTMRALESGDVVLVGDVNNDVVLNIKDATLIQKHVAKLADLEDENALCADVNDDEKISVQDATSIQKSIAKI